MSSPLPPDPYVALGVPKDAEAALIKTTYRKLALKCHPDKVTDESQKTQAAEQFHRIQQAYEIIGDEDKRSRYDAQIKLAQLRRDVMERQGGSGPRVDVRTAAYEMPTASPGRTAFSTRGPERVYEERRPGRQSETDHDYFGDQRNSSRKNDDYERAKRASPRDDRDRYRASERDTKESERVNRTDKRRTRDKETKREREKKYFNDDSESDDSSSRSRFESAKRKDLERERERYLAEQSKRQREQDVGDDRSRRPYQEKELDARSYIDQAESRRPTPSRTASVRDAYVDMSRERPAYVRRSSTKPKPYEREPPPPQSSSRRDRDRDRERKPSAPEVSDYMDSRDRRERRQPPPLHTTNSAPGSIQVPDQAMPSRAATIPVDFERRDSLPHHPQMRRSETLPIHPGARGRESSAPRRPSNLRNTEYNSGLPTPGATPDYSPITPVIKKYRIPSPSIIEEEPEYPPRPRTQVREPSDRDRDRERERPRQPAPIRTTTTQPYYDPMLSESPTSFYKTSSPLRRDAIPDYEPRDRQQREYAEISGKSAYDYAPADRDRDSRYRRSPTEYDKLPYPKDLRPGGTLPRMTSGYTTTTRRASGPPRPSMSRTTSSVH